VSTPPLLVPSSQHACHRWMPTEDTTRPDVMLLLTWYTSITQMWGIKFIAEVAQKFVKPEANFLDGTSNCFAACKDKVQACDSDEGRGSELAAAQGFRNPDMVKRKMVVEETLEAAVADWKSMAPRSKAFLTGEGYQRSEWQNAQAFTAELKEQCEQAAVAFMGRLQSDFLNYKPTWHTCPKLLSCLLDQELAPHFAHKVWPACSPHCCVCVCQW
jgi:hypothetical protein